MSIWAFASLICSIAPPWAKVGVGDEGEDRRKEGSDKASQDGVVDEGKDRGKGIASASKSTRAFPVALHSCQITQSWGFGQL